jgi:DNA processing protein
VLRDSGLFTKTQLERLLKRRGEAEEIALRLDELALSGTAVVTCFDDSYPPELLRLPHPPSYLYRQGTGELPGPCMFVAAADQTDEVVIAAAVAIGKQLAVLGVVVVSNLSGVEAAAHVGALAAAGRHLVFLPCGHDAVANLDSAVVVAKVAEAGIVYSEYAPEMEPTEDRRAEASRLAVGAAQGVLVIGEPDLHATVAVETAVAAGKPVFYLTGADPTVSALLLAAGAYPVAGPESLERILPLL